MMHLASIENVDYNQTIFIIQVADVIDMGETENLWIFLKTIIAGGCLKVIINMDGLDFIDSYGISVLINSAKLLRGKKGDLAIIKVPERIEKIFKPVNLNRFIQMYNSETDAVNFLKLV